MHYLPFVLVGIPLQDACLTISAPLRAAYAFQGALRVSFVSAAILTNTRHFCQAESVPHSATNRMCTIIKCHLLSGSPRPPSADWVRVKKIAKRVVGDASAILERKRCCGYGLGRFYSMKVLICQALFF